MSNARFYLRIVVRKRVQGAKNSANESLNEWPDPPAGTGRYSARTLVLNAGEEIRTGVQETTSFLKLEVNGQRVPIEAADRVHVINTGVLYRVSASPVRMARTTQIELTQVTERDDGR